MSTAQLKKEFLRLTDGLTKEHLEQMIAFVRAIRQKEKHLNDKSASSLSTLDQGEAAHLEEEFTDYKKRYPIE